MKGGRKPYNLTLHALTTMRRWKERQGGGNAYNLRELAGASVISALLFPSSLAILP